MVEPSSPRPSSPRDAQEPSYDPRDIITPYAFEVDEDLLGTELATPKRRLAALLTDLLLAAMLAALGGILVGFAVAFIFFRIATRTRVQHTLKRWARATLALGGAFVLFITVVAVIGGGWNVPFLGGASVSTAPDDSAQQAQVQAIHDSVMTALEHEGIRLDELQQAGVPSPLLDFLATGQTDADALNATERDRAAALLRRYADALAAQDTTRLDSLQARAATVVAGPQIQNLRTALNRASDRIDALEDRNEELTDRVNNPSLWRVVRSTANDFGLSFGWVGVYFTIFLSWWNGQTPGKWLLGLRVVRLDGNPLTLWPAFERFGGYAAGLATGLLGFAQVYWDPNRQGIHDRIAHTVVIRTRQS